MNRRFRIVAASTTALLAVGVGVVVTLQRRPDPTPLLSNTAVTLARATVAQDLAAPDATPASGPNLVAEGFDLGQVLRRDGDGPWYSQIVDPDRVSTPYIADVAVCGTDASVLIASGNVGTEVSGTVLLDDVKAAVPTVWRSAGGKPWTRVTLTEAPQPSSLRAIVSAPTTEQPSRLIAIGQQLSIGRNPYVAVSDDCGSSWRVEQLSVGRANTVADALWADDQGVLIVGRTDGAEPDTDSIMVWRSTDSAKPTAFAPTIVETTSRADAPIESVMRADDFVRIGLVDFNQRRMSALGWDGSPTGMFTRIGEPVVDAFPLGLVGMAVGIHSLTKRSGERIVELQRFDAAGNRVDVLPRINGQDFRQIRFVGYGGSTMWLIGETEDFVLKAWSLTLLSTAS